MTADDFYLIIGIKEAEIFQLTKLNNSLRKDLEAARAQLEELARDRNHPL